MHFLTRTISVLCAAAALHAGLAVGRDWKTLKDANGNRIPDFSYSGYHSSAISLPSTHRTVTKTVPVGSGDQSKVIQAALNDVSQAGGGVVALEAGSYTLKTGLVIPNGTTLRGAGPGKTTLLPASQSMAAVTLGSAPAAPKIEKTVAITDSYVTVGANVVTVKSATGLKVGQSVWIQRRVTIDWIRANGNGGLGDNPDPKYQWLSTDDVVYQPRTIAAISGNKITLNIGLTDQLDAKYMSPQLATYTPPPAADSEMGVEALSITQKPSCSGAAVNTAPCKTGMALSFSSWAFNSYARSLAITGYGNAVKVQADASQITIASVSIHRDAASDNSKGYWADISLMGYQTLVINSGTKVSVDGATSIPVLTQGLTPGPNAVVRHFVQDDTHSTRIEPHAHWAHGFLVDNSTSPVTLYNRGTAGSGHGWAINSGVAWNVVGNYNIQSPPLGTNWGIGDRGSKKAGSNGTFYDEQKEATPASLYDAQLADRGIAA